MIREWKARLRKIETPPKKKTMQTGNEIENPREEKQFWQVQTRAQSKANQI